MNSDRIKYYRLRVSTDSKVIGRKYPQLKPLTGDEIEMSRNIQYLDDNFLIQETDSIYALEKSSKRTDVLSCGLYPYFVLSEKAKRIFESFKIRDTRFISMKVIEPTRSNWYVIYFPHTLESMNLINFDETLFYITDGLGEENHGEFVLGEHCVDKLLEWRRIYKTTGEGQEIRIKNLVLKSECSGIDLFYLSPFYQSDVIISENVKIALEASEILGLSYKQIELSFC